jgi:hypothetical protein
MVLVLPCGNGDLALFWKHHPNGAPVILTAHAGNNEPGVFFQGAESIAAHSLKNLQVHRFRKVILWDNGCMPKSLKLVLFLSAVR